MTVRVRADLLEEYDEWCEAEDVCRSEAIRQHMRETVGSDIDGVQPPSDPLLRDGFEAIRTATDHRGIVPTPVAKSRIAESTRVKGRDAIRCVISPLDEMGYLNVVEYGKLRVIGTTE